MLFKKSYGHVSQLGSKSSGSRKSLGTKLQHGSNIKHVIYDIDISNTAHKVKSIFEK